MTELLRLESVSRQYPGVLALDSVSMTVNAGEVHVLFGENGAGKSTLISLMAGVTQPSSGALFCRGEPVSLRSVQEARKRGISAVFQEFSLVETLTVAENLLLGDEPVRNGSLTGNKNVPGGKGARPAGFRVKPRYYGRLPFPGRSTDGRDC